MKLKRGTWYGEIELRVHMRILDGMETITKKDFPIKNMPKRKWASLLSCYENYNNDKKKEREKTYKPNEIIRKTVLRCGVVVTVRERSTTNH